jgi:hypothetical protein
VAARAVRSYESSTPAGLDVAEPYATRREFDDFRDETREELKWLRRFLIGVLISAIGGNLVATFIAFFTRPAAP